jgi:serine/threonine protein kinase
MRKGKAMHPDKIENYTILKVISQGTYGIVYLATDESQSVLYAIKAMKNKYLAD